MIIKMFERPFILKSFKHLLLCSTCIFFAILSMKDKRSSKSIGICSYGFCRIFHGVSFEKKKKELRFYYSLVQRHSQTKLYV